MLRSHRSAADGGRSPRKPDRAQPSIEAVNHTLRFKTHSERSLVIDHPGRAFSERDHLFMARPPLLAKEGKTLGLNGSRVRGFAGVLKLRCELPGQVLAN